MIYNESLSKHLFRKNAPKLKPSPHFLNLLVLLFLFSSPTYANCAITDDTGAFIHLKKPAERIISLAPDITETLFAIGAGNKIVGVVSGSDYPASAQNIPSIGSYTGIDLEKILKMHPDLIIGWSQAFSRQLAVLKKFGIPIYISDPHRLEDVPRAMKNLGCLTGTEKNAEKAAAIFSHELALLHQTYQAEKKVRVFYQIGSYSLITINKDSWITQAIMLCGGENIFANAKSVAPEIGWEAVVTSNPDVIINSAVDDQWKTKWTKWPEMTAVKKEYLFTLNPDLIERAGPRLVEGTKRICDYLEMVRKKST